MMIYFYRSF